MIRDGPSRNAAVSQLNGNTVFIGRGVILRYNTGRIVSILEIHPFMSDHAHVVDRIEKANDARPFCSCGRHTTPVWRDGVVWLECASLSEPRDGVVARLIAAATAPAHVRTAIVAVPDDGIALAA